MKNKVALSIALIGALSASINANAAIIKVSDAPFAFSYSSIQDGFKLLTTGTFDILSLTPTQAKLAFVVNNKSTAANGDAVAPTDVRLTDFGFGFTGSTVTKATFIDARDGGLIKAAAVSKFPGVEGIQVCAFADTICGGQTFGGIYDNASDAFKITIDGMFTKDHLNLTSLGSKFDTSTRYTNGWYDDTPAPVPEPGSIAIMGLGLAGLVLVTSKRKA